MPAPFEIPNRAEANTKIKSAEYNENMQYIEDALNEGGGGSASTWNEITGTFSRQTSDDPSYTLRISNDDLTDTLQAGMKIKWTQNAIVRYGWITKVELISSTHTDITICTRLDSSSTDYDMLDSTTYPITAVNWSDVDCPFGFPRASYPYWTFQVSDQTERTQSSPVAGTWYNLGSFSIVIPIGVWEVFMLGSWTMNKSGQGFIYGTLSTANNSESDSDFTVESGASARTRFSMTNQKRIALTSKTTHYLNAKTSSASVTDIRLNETESGQTSKAIVRCTLGYAA